MLSENEEKLNEEISQNTIKVRCKGWVENFFANLPHVIEGTGVRILAQRFKGIPIIIVGAGPSLDKNIAQLKDLRNRAVICACDAALEAVLNAGCRPHLTLVADSKERVVGYLTPDGHDTSDLVLIADTRMHPVPREAWKGQILWYNGMPIDGYPFSHVQWQWTGQIGALGSGGCVTSSIWCMSLVVLQTSPNVFIGQDCSFKVVNRHHASVVKKTEFYDTTDLITDIDIYGDKVFTTGPLLSFKNWYEEMFVRNPGIHINATQGGILKRGCLIMSLEEAADMFLKQEYPIDDILADCLANADECMREHRNDGLSEPVKLPSFLSPLLEPKLISEVQENRLLSLTDEMQDTVNAD